MVTYALVGDNKFWVVHVDDAVKATIVFMFLIISYSHACNTSPVDIV